MKIFNLPCYGIKVAVNSDGEGGSIASDLKVDTNEEGDDLYNAAMDGLTSMILAHAIAGIDISTPAYIEGIESVVNACANNF